MKVKLSAVPVGSKFIGSLPGTVFMKIKEAKEELLLEKKPVLWRRNVVVIEGPEKGGLGLLPDDYEVELVS